MVDTFASAEAAGRNIRDGFHAIALPDLAISPVEPIWIEGLPSDRASEVGTSTVCCAPWALWFYPPSSLKRFLADCSLAALGCKSEEGDICRLWIVPGRALLHSDPSHILVTVDRIRNFAPAEPEFKPMDIPAIDCEPLCWLNLEVEIIRDIRASMGHPAPSKAAIVSAGIAFRATPRAS